MERDLVFVAISLFFWGLGESSFQPFQTLYLQQFGAPPIQIGTILGVYGIASTMAHIPAGYLADRIGRRPMMWSAWFLGVCATVIMGFASSLGWFVAGMLLYGITLFVLAPMNSYVSVARGKLSVGRALTLISASYNLGVIFGPIIGGLIGNTFGYQSIFRFSAIIFLVSTIFIMLIRSQSVEDTSIKHNEHRLLKNSAYIRFLTLFAFATCAMYISQPLAPNFLQNERSISLLKIGQLYSIGGIGIVIINLSLGRFMAWKGYILGQAFVALFALFLWRGSGFVWYAIAFFWLGGFRASRSLAIAHIRSLVSSVNMGLAFGFAETISAIALIFAPILSGVLYEYNPDWVYISGLILIMMSILLNVLVSRPLSQAYA